MPVPKGKSSSKVIGSKASEMSTPVCKEESKVDNNSENSSKEVEVQQEVESSDNEKDEFKDEDYNQGEPHDQARVDPQTSVYAENLTNLPPYYPPNVQYSPPNFYPPFPGHEFIINNLNMPPPMLYFPPGYNNNHFNPPSLSGASSTHSSPHLNPLSPHLNPNVNNHPSLLNRQTLKHRNMSQFNTNIYIKGLPPQTSDKSLFNMCSAYGTILSSKSIIDTKSQLCRGYGFVMYENINQAQHAISCLNSNGFEASFAKLRSSSEEVPSNGAFRVRLKALQDQTSTNIYISNLPQDYNEAKLEELFAPYKIISNRILRDEFNKSRGVGFARMQDRESAQRIIDQFNQFQLIPNGKPLQVRFADSTAQKQLKFSDKYPANFPEYYGTNLPPLDLNGNPVDYTMSPPFYPVDFEHYNNGGYMPYPSGPVYFQPPNLNPPYYPNNHTIPNPNETHGYSYNTSPYVLPQNATLPEHPNQEVDKLNDLVEDLDLNRQPQVVPNPISTAPNNN